MGVPSTDREAPQRSEPDSAAKGAVHRQFATETGAAALAAGAGPDQTAQYLRALGERGRAQEFVAQQYAGRYALELLQNADDAAADRGRQGRVRFVLSETSLMVGDDGMGFGPEQVQALCTLGDSSKDRSKSIGYKGVGFKSVLEVTNTPQVYSADTSFGFDEARVRRELQRLLPTEDLEDLPIPAYAFPFELTLDDAGVDAAAIARLRDEGYTTVIRLPLKLATSWEHANRLLTDAIRPRLLLLTQGLKMLAVEGTEKPFTAEILRESLAACTHCVLQSDTGAVEEWLLYRSSHNLGPNDPRPSDPRWKRTTSFGTAVAVSIVDNAPQPAVDTPLHVYFPTDDVSGYPFILHADWALDPDRRHLARSAEFEAYNNFVTQHLVAHLVANVVPDLLERFPKKSGVAECLCRDDQGAGSGQTVGALCQSALDDVRFLPGGRRSRLSPTEAWLLPDGVDVPGIYRWTDYGKQRGSLREDMEGNQRVSAFLSRRRRRRAHSIPFTKFREPSAGDTPHFYQFLRSLLRDWSLRERIKDMRSVPLVGGGMGNPTDRIFMASSERSRTDLSKYVQFARGSAAWELEVLHGLGVKEATWRNVILHYLVPLLAKPGVTTESRISHLRALQAYLVPRESTDEVIRDAVGEVLLPARTATGSSGYWVPAKELYFGQEWADLGRDTEAIYGPFGKAEFLDVPDTWDPFGFDAGFYRFMGVRDHPRLVPEPSAYWHRYWLDAVFARRADAAGWVHCDEVTGAALCPMGHPESQWVQENCAIDRFDQIAQAANLERTEAMLRQLIKHWDEYARAIDARIHCGHGSHHGSRVHDRKIPSLMAFEVRRSLWVPAVREGVTELVAPDEAWILKRGAPQVLQQVVTRLPDYLATAMPSAMAWALRLPSIDSGSPSAMVRMLTSIGKHGEAAPEGLRVALKEAAEWVLDHLEESLGEKQLPEIPDLALPALRDGKISFEIRPWATGDPLLEDAFSVALPVLPGAARFPRCCIAFELPSLDEAPKDVHPINEIVERSLEAQGMIRRLAPLVLAQMSRRHPRQRDDAAETLASCVARCWSRIDLSIQAGGASVSVPPVPSYPHRELDGKWHLDLATPEGEAADWGELGKMIASALGDPTQGKNFALWLLAGETIHPYVMKTEQLTDDDIAQAQSLLADHFSRTVQVDDTWSGALTEAAIAVRSPLPSSTSHTDSATAEGPATTGSDLQPDHTNVVRPRLRDILLTPVQAQRDEEQEVEARPSHRPSRRTPYAFDGDDLPPIDHNRVSSVQPGTKPALGVAPSTRDGHGPAVRDLDPDFHARRDFRGRRAEELVVEFERKRLSAQGMSKDAVEWISEQFPFAPYDLESLDETGQKIYIEVKATQSSDPSEPFPISAQELAAAREHGSSHWLYRVTRVDAVDPAIIKVRDPYALLETGEAVIDPTKYLMRIGLQTPDGWAADWR